MGCPATGAGDSGRREAGEYGGGGTGKIEGVVCRALGEDSGGGPRGESAIGGMRDPRCFPWNENEQPKVVYRSLYQKGKREIGRPRGEPRDANQTMEPSPPHTAAAHTPRASIPFPSPPATGAEQNVLEVYHHAKEVWYHEYQFRAGSGLSGEKEVITCQTKAKICLGDVDKTLESFSARALSAGYEFCYTYSCNIQKTDAFGLDYSLSPTDTLPNVVKQKASSRPRPKKKRKKHKVGGQEGPTGEPPTLG